MPLLISFLLLHSEAAILCVDGVGEWATTSIAYGKDESINMISKRFHFLRVAL